MGYEMMSCHRALLTRHRVYLLHNMHPTEEFWSSLISNGVLSTEMAAGIKTYKTANGQIGGLLDVLPTRGPDAFEHFCDALLETGHAHVAEYLKTHEATDTFRLEVEPHCSDYFLDMLVSVFRRSTPALQNFAERKFELLLREQESDIKQREAEFKEMQKENLNLQLEISHLRSFLSSSSQTTESLATEVQRTFVSKSFLREERKHVEDMKQNFTMEGFEKAAEFYTNMMHIMKFIDKFAGPNISSNDGDTPCSKCCRRASDGSLNSRPFTRGSIQDKIARNSALQDKLQAIVATVNTCMKDTITKEPISGNEIRRYLEVVLQTIQEVTTDVGQVKDALKVTMRQKQRLENETLSLLHNFQEIRRLERETKEKRSHISELTKRSHVVKRKGNVKYHRKELQSIQQNLHEKRTQLSQVQQTLERKLNSADARLHILLELIPDLGTDSDGTSSDAETLSVSSRLATPEGALGDTILRRKYEMRRSSSLTLEQQFKSRLNTTLTNVPNDKESHTDYDTKEADDKTSTMEKAAKSRTKKYVLKQTSEPQKTSVSDVKQTFEMTLAKLKQQSQDKLIKYDNEEIRKSWGLKSKHPIMEESKVDIITPQNSVETKTPQISDPENSLKLGSIPRYMSPRRNRRTAVATKIPTHLYKLDESHSSSTTLEGGSIPSRDPSPYSMTPGVDTLSSPLLNKKHSQRIELSTKKVEIKINQKENHK